jgi:hypothetical protein|tara:strand:+ start:6145 stop:6816 length:672 start_codon:yes stop_codon:yes gene_type:complete
MNTKHTFNKSIYKFRELVSEAFGVDNLEKIHEIKPEWIKDNYKKLNIHNENTTTFHEVFYKKLNDNWTDFYETYENFIHNIILPLLDEKFHYQYLPSFRIHLPNNNQAVHTWHYDSDQLHKHPEGEINFYLPLTKSYGTNAIWAESEPFKLDFKSLDSEYGEFWQTNFNKCIHGNKPNISNGTRISFDFRIIPISKYNPDYKGASESKSNKFIVGSYYKELNK